MLNVFTSIESGQKVNPPWRETPLKWPMFDVFVSKNIILNSRFLIFKFQARIRFSTQCYLWIILSLLYSSSPLLLNSSTPRYSSTLLLLYSSTHLLFYHSTLKHAILFVNYSFTPLLLYSSTSLLLYSSTPLFLYSSTLLLFYSSTLLLFYSSTPLLLYSSTSLLLYSYTHLHP